MSEVFLSYSREDTDRARRIAESLKALGLSVWWDKVIPPGRRFDEVIEEAIEGARCVVVLWSQTSIESDWVKEEAERGKQRGILIPVLIDEVDIPLGFGRMQAASLVGWQGDASNEEFRKACQAIASLVGRPLTHENLGQHVHTLLHPSRPHFLKALFRWSRWQTLGGALAIILMAFGFYVAWPPLPDKSVAAVRPATSPISVAKPPKQERPDPAVAQASASSPIVAAESPAERTAVPVPAVQGRSLAEARAALLDAGLVAGTIRRRASQRPVGTVLDQSPNALVSVPAGSRVSLVIAERVMSEARTGPRANTRCADITMRQSLGERLSPAERTILLEECRQ